MPTGRLKSERGDTLVEILMAVAILGIAFTALLGGLATSVLGSDHHRRNTTAETVARNYAEALKDTTAVAYVPCATTYNVTGFSAPAGYAVSVTGVEHWQGDNPASFGACPAFGDLGVQRVTVQATATNGRAAETVQVLKRRP